MNRLAPLPLVLPFALAASLGACTDMLGRLQSVGSKPPLSPIENPANAAPPVTMPSPTPVALDVQANSLWRPGARAFFKDQRASQVGDILTVTINIADTASLENSSSRSRTNSENAALPQFLGYNVASVVKRLPGLNQSADPTNLVEMSSSSSTSGTGTIDRSETITLRVAATVTQVLPNGNLVISGSQEVRVNNEARVLQVGGVLRPQDLRSTNEIPHDRLAEARISYGGRGQISDVQQARWGQQIYDILFPF
jgi:flagellar L-ring protein precursor FlgH